MHGAQLFQPAQPLASPFTVMAMVARPRWLGRVGWAIAIFLCIMPFGMLFVPWQQNIKGTGRVQAFAALEREQAIKAPLSGRVVRWRVQEGAHVNAGDPLVEISDIDPNLIGRLQQERNGLQGKYDAAVDKVRSYEQQIVNLEATRDLAVTAATHRLEMTREKVNSSVAMLEASRAALKAAEAQLQRYKTLEADGLVSRRDFEVAERDHELARTSVDSAEASLKATRNELQAMEAELKRIRTDADSKIDSARATLNEAQGLVQESLASLAKLDVSISRQQSQLVTAPRDGYVFRLHASQDGEIVKAGDSLMVLVPKTDNPSVELWIDGNDAPLVRQGSPVRLQFEGWPAVQFVGWPSVAVGTFGGRVALIDSTDNGKGQFRVLVVPDEAESKWPDSRYLRQGVRAKGWVLLNQVTVGYEVWRQLNGFPPVIAPTEPKQDAEKDRGVGKK
ncbi:MAG: HlyD family efflux transporter periplasmic adaptor subunit [Planctomycetes bacterium]|nr:HlyD family efflux transporter periplasmic adaptor subunit [Planctomycetota bacterium]